MSLTLPKKIFINNAFYLLPITVLLYLMFNGFSKDINFAEKELVGAELNKLATSLLQNSVDNKSNTDESKNSQEAILVKKNQYVSELNLSEDALRSKGKESLLEGNFNSTIKGMAEAKDNGQSVAALNDLIAYVGDSSNLILDPDLDTYYLMDATIYAVPQLINRLNSINLFLKENQEKLASLTSEQKMKLNSLIEILKSIDSTRLSGDIDTSIKEDKNFHEENSNLQGQVKENMQKLDTSLKNYSSLLEKVNLSGAVTPDEIKQSYEAVSTDLRVFQMKALDVLSEMLQSRVDHIKSSRTKALGTGIIAVLMALGISFYITKTIKSELGQLITTLGMNSDEVESTSRKNMDISTELSSAVTEQASSVQEISATTEEISQMTQRNNENVKVSMEATNKTAQTVTNANGLMNELSRTVENLKFGNDQIIERSNLNSQNFESIINIMKTIEDKTRVINDIVFQTKLLSFNASVEAARAGEQGKGFSVVAEEVGNLAQMSGKAAQEITDLLDSSLRKVRELTVEADSEIKKVVDISTSNITTVIDKVVVCRNINEEILMNSDKITSLIGEVVIASEEQTKGVVEITKAINSFDVVTERNSQLASELNNSAKSLNEKSNELKDVIAKLLKMSGTTA